MRNPLITFIFLLSSIIALAENNDTLHFEWIGDSINGEYFEKSAMIIPVQILGDTNDYFFQFDTGANTSSIYTGNEHGVNGITPTVALEGLKTNLGIIEVDTLSYMSPFVENEKMIIGTIGSNLLKNKIVQIDFLNQGMIISNELNSEKFNLFPMMLSYGRPVIELQLGKHKYNFLFDTGSSIFELWTTKKIWKKSTLKNLTPSEFSIWSWGQLNTVYTAPLSYEMSFLKCKEVNLNSASYSSNKMYATTFKQAGVQGVIGNKPFQENVILLDFKNLQIGIKKCT